MELANSSTIHYFRGYVFMGLAEICFSRFLGYQLDLATGGRAKSMIANFHFVRRWGLDKFIVYDKVSRKKIVESKQQSLDLFEKAIAEFTAGKLNSELAYAAYNLAGKLALTFYFAKAKKPLTLAKQLAEAAKDNVLLSRIAELEESIKDKNKHTRNYVEEFGLDLP